MTGAEKLSTLSASSSSSSSMPAFGRRMWVYYVCVVALAMSRHVQVAVAFTVHPQAVVPAPAIPSRRQQQQRTTGSPSSLKMVEGAADMAAFYSSCLDQYYFPTQMATGAMFSTIGDVLAQSRTIYLESRGDSDDVKNGDSNDSVSDNDTNFGSAFVAQFDPQRSLNYFLKGMGGGIMWACWYQIADTWSMDITNQLFESMELTPSGMMSEADSFNDAMTSTTTVAATATTTTSKWFQPARTVVSILLEQFVVCPVFYTFWDIPVPALLSGSPARQIPIQVQQKLGPLLIANAKVWTLVNTITYNLPLEYRVLFASFADIIWQCINASITSQNVVVPAASPVGGATMTPAGVSRASATSAMKVTTTNK